MFRRLSALCLAAVLLLTGCTEPTSKTYKTYEVPGVSMEPTLQHGQKVRARTVKSGGYKPKHGDIVVFSARTEWRAGQRDTTFVKRVIAIGGETIACCDLDGKVTLNGVSLEEPYLHPDGRPDPFGPVTVPAGRLWLMGDWRSRSGDSRELYASSNDPHLSGFA